MQNTQTGGEMHQRPTNESHTQIVIARHTDRQKYIKRWCPPKNYSNFSTIKVLYSQ